MFHIFVEQTRFETCAQDLECAKLCVRAYQSRNQDSCRLARQKLLGESQYQLTCADYGRMHFGGLGSCGNPDTPNIMEYIANLTMFCGCAGKITI